MKITNKHKGKQLHEVYKYPGKPRKIKDPKELWNLALEWVSYMTDQTIDSQMFVGKDGKEVLKHTKHPLTMESFYIFSGISKQLFHNMENRLKHNRDNPTYNEDIAKIDKEFLDVCTRIRQISFNQQFAEASAGNYNANIVARYLGLTEKKDITSNGQQVNSLGTVKIELPEGFNLPTGDQEPRLIEDIQESEVKVIDINKKTG